MSDLELTKLCAEAMGYDTKLGLTHVDVDTLRPDGDTIIFSDQTIYRPLRDDAQAMALVKKFGLTIQVNGEACSGAYWRVFTGKAVSDNPNLNRAICECVAKMQAAKRG